MLSSKIFHKNDIVVSICILTHNHEQYILETLKGVFKQNINFKCEILIFDDNSIDKTVYIVQEFLKNNQSIYFEVILNINSLNLGMSKNFYSALIQCSGKYIAMCDGDDYWIDSFKLQKQVDFLEKNREFVICYHPVNILNDSIFKDDFFIEKRISTISSYNDLMFFGNYMQTCSVVFKNFISNFPIDKILFINDYILWFWLSRFGKIYRIEEVMGVYRLGSGTWSVLSNSRQTIHTLNSLFESRKIVKNQTDIIIIDNRINSLKYSLLPNELKISNINSENISQFLSKNIKLKVLLYSLYLKIIRFIFN
jgi:glycosyltransferase involved in cell wall biosynthesis